MRVDTQTILTIHNSIITRWHRPSISYTVIAERRSKIVVINVEMESMQCND